MKLVVCERQALILSPHRALGLFVTAAKPIYLDKSIG